MKRHELLNEALVLAVDAHSGQYDKAGMPYILHPIRVAENVQFSDLKGTVAHEYQYAKIVALLHDVVEDTDVTLKQIRTQFGRTITDSVDALSKRKGTSETYREYLDRIRDAARFDAGIAMSVKLEDMKDNTRPERLAALSIEKRLRLVAKYTRARHYLLTGEWYENEDLDRIIEQGYKK
jgi:(p)ppGpp synthase/HD superfamily hydrolase